LLQKPPPTALTTQYCLHSASYSNKTLSKHRANGDIKCKTAKNEPKRGFQPNYSGG